MNLKNLSTKYCIINFDLKQKHFDIIIVDLFNKFASVILKCIKIFGLKFSIFENFINVSVTTRWFSSIWLIILETRK